MLALVALSGAAAAPLLNFSFDRHGSYTPILLVLAGISAGMLLLLLLGCRGAARYRAGLLKKEKCEETR